MNIYNLLKFATLVSSEEKSTVKIVTNPSVCGPDIGVVNSNVTFISFGSISAFEDAVIDYYEWTLPDNSRYQGNILDYHIPAEIDIGDTLIISCIAIDTLGNRSSDVIKIIEIVDSVQYPVTNSLTWNDDNHKEKNTYDLTIDAMDPQEQELDYKLFCNHDDVEIIQDGIDKNIFHVTYPIYKKNMTVEFNAIVYNEDGLLIYENIEKDILYIHPEIFHILWNNNIHEENKSYNLTILASDPQRQNLTYEVECDDDDIIIISDGSNKTLFHITYPEYDENTIVTYTITVTNEELLSDIETCIKIVVNIPCGNRGIFGGGYDESNILDTIEYITISISGNATDFGDLTITRSNLASTSNGTDERGVFGGGYDGSSRLDIIDYITISSPGNAIDFGDLIIARSNLASTSNGINDRGIFAGGYGGSYLNTIDYIIISNIGNVTGFGNLTFARYGLTACSNGTNDRGIFGGGYNSNNLNIIDYITISTPGNATDFGDLTVSRRSLTSCSNGTNDRGIFGGGYNGSNYFNTIEYITISNIGNASDFGNLIISRYDLASCSNGTNDRGIFGGGYNGSNYFNTIEYITISNIGNAADFGNLTISKYRLTACSDG